MIALAVPIFLQFASPWAQLPPPQFDHPYHGHLTVKTGTAAEIHQWCHSYFASACAMPRGKNCTIILPLQQPWSSPQLFDYYRRHEIGHCNGWRH